MEVQKDFKEFLGLLNAHEIDFMIVGGYALAYHGVPRYTGDIDVFVKPDRKNALRIIEVLEEFGFGSLELSIDDFQKEDHVVQLGLPPVRIDIITSLSGVTWKQADSEKEPGFYGNVAVNFIGKKQFIANKKAIGRAKDLADIEALGEE